VLESDKKWSNQLVKSLQIVKVVKSTCKKFTNCCFQCKTTNFGYLN